MEADQAEHAQAPPVGARRRAISLAGLALAVALGVPLGLGAFAFDYAEGSSYLSNDPRACVNCHIMRDQYDAWQKSPHHANATCNDCHVPQDLVGKYATKMDHGYRHSKGFTFQDFHEPIRITPGSLRVVENNCVRCHGALVSEIVGHGLPEGDLLSCVKCHGGIGHGPRR
ncbi:cytochrome c nitrite reductase small subunit [Phycisphaerales bacterium]|nr:cytochrome c nitrite reductase small subunit [Phycisphaerales bacterium]